MEKLVRNAICHYNGFVAEAQLYEKWLLQSEELSLKKSLALLQVKVATVDSWLNLLNFDERFVVQKHLIEEIEWPRVAFEYRERWKNEFIRTERSLQIYQANAIAKIATFANRHREITLRLFADLMCTEDDSEL